MNLWVKVLVCFIAGIGAGMGVHKTVWVSGSGNGVASRVTPFPFA